MQEKTDVRQGTLALKTLDLLGSLHGYGMARRIEQISGDLLAVKQGTLYAVLSTRAGRRNYVRVGSPQRTTARPVSVG